LGSGETFQSLLSQVHLSSRGHFKPFQEVGLRCLFRKPLLFDKDHTSNLGKFHRFYAPLSSPFRFSPASSRKQHSCTRLFLKITHVEFMSNNHRSVFYAYKEVEVLECLNCTLSSPSCWFVTIALIQKIQV